jgi:hypothetical protein
MYIQLKLAILGPLRDSCAWANRSNEVTKEEGDEGPIVRDRRSDTTRWAPCTSKFGVYDVNLIWIWDLTLFEVDWRCENASNKGQDGKEIHDDWYADALRGAIEFEFNVCNSRTAGFILNASRLVVNRNLVLGIVTRSYIASRRPKTTHVRVMQVWNTRIWRR